MKRSPAPKRRTPLANGSKALRATASAFRAPSRGEASPADRPVGADRRASEKRPARTGRRKATLKPYVRGRAFGRSHGLCVMCLHRAGARVDQMSTAALRHLARTDQVRRAVQLHHVLPEGKWPHLAKLATNLVGVCVACHDEHERAHRRIPIAALPGCAIALAEREGLGWYLDRTYPTE